LRGWIAEGRVGDKRGSALVGEGGLGVGTWVEVGKERGHHGMNSQQGKIDLKVCYKDRSGIRGVRVGIDSRGVHKSVGGR